MPIRSPLAFVPLTGLVLSLILAVWLRPTYTEEAAARGTVLPSRFSSDQPGTVDPDRKIPLQVLFSRDPLDTPSRSAIESLIILYVTIGVMGSGALLFAVPRPRT